MKRTVLTALCVAAALPMCTAMATANPAGAPAPAARVENLLLMSVQGKLVIETDGSVGKYTISDTLTPELDALLAKAIPRWRFEPVLIDGSPRRAETEMRLVLAASPAGKNYEVRLENVVFPGQMHELDRPTPPVPGTKVDATGRKMNPPIYPRSLERAGVTGRVLLGMHYTPDGHMVEVVPVQTMLFNTRGPEPELARAIDALEQSALTAARKWTVDVKVAPGAKPSERDFTAFTTVEYVMDEPGKGHVPHHEPTGQWRLVNRTPKRPMPWLADSDAPKVGVADLAEGETLPLAGGPKLMTPPDAAAH